MRVRIFLAIFVVSLFAASCTPSGAQPVFNSNLIPEATSIPMSPSPHVVATLTQRIDSFDVSPDGKAIALATNEGVRLYDLQSYKYLRSLNNGELATAVAWSPDGSKLAVGSTKDYGVPFFVGGDSSNSDKAHLTVWDTSTWKPVFEPEFGNEMVNQMFRALEWSPDNRSLAFSPDLGGVQVLDTQTGRSISNQKDFAGSVIDLSWSPDGSRLVATNDMAYTVRRWRVSDNQYIRLFDQRAGNSMTLAWSPDGSRIASGHSGGGVCLWTAATNRCGGFIQAHRSATFSLAWSPDGSQLATGGGILRIWDSATGKLIKAFGEETDYIYQRIQWLPGGSLATLEYSPQKPGSTLLRLWDPSNGSILAEFRGQQPTQ